MDLYRTGKIGKSGVSSLIVIFFGNTLKTVVQYLSLNCDFMVLTSRLSHSSMTEALDHNEIDAKLHCNLEIRLVFSPIYSYSFWNKGVGNQLQ